MALSQTFSIVRSGVLQHLRLTAGSNCLQTLGVQSLGLVRGFAEQGTFLDKGEVTDRVLSVVKNFDKVDPSKKDLGLDSLDTVEVVMAFEEEFAVEIPDSEADRILSTADAIDYLASHPMAK